jgi:hypothetical protein
VVRYILKPSRPRGSVFWNLALGVVLVAALGAVSHALAVAVVTLVVLGVGAVAVVRATTMRRPGRAGPDARRR